MESARSYNSNLALPLLGAANACHAASQQPSASDIFSVAEIRAVSLLPQVDGISSDRASPSLLWSWSADYPKSASFPLVTWGSFCPQGSISFYSPAAPKLSNATLTYQYGVSSRSVPLSQSWPNPVPLDLDGRLAPEDLGEPFTSLKVELEGALTLQYSYSRVEYVKSCTKSGESLSCSCLPDVTYGKKIFMRSLADSRIFLIENGPVQPFFANPPLGSRLDGPQEGRVVFFTRRLPSKISVFEDGRPLGVAEPYQFVLSTGPCGELEVSKNFSPHGTLFINKSDFALHARQLADLDAAYLPFYLAFQWNSSAGKKALELSFEDMFSASDNFSRSFSVRDPSPFGGSGYPGAIGYGNTAAMQIRNASDSLSGAAFPPPPAPARQPLGLSSLAPIFALPALLWLAWRLRGHGKLN